MCIAARIFFSLYASFASMRMHGSEQSLRYPVRNGALVHRTYGGTYAFQDWVRTLLDAIDSTEMFSGSVRAKYCR